MFGLDGFEMEYDVYARCPLETVCVSYLDHVDDQHIVCIPLETLAVEMLDFAGPWYYNSGTSIASSSSSSSSSTSSRSTEWLSITSSTQSTENDYYDDHDDDNALSLSNRYYDYDYNSDSSFGGSSSIGNTPRSVLLFGSRIYDFSSSSEDHADEVDDDDGLVHHRIHDRVTVDFDAPQASFAAMLWPVDAHDRGLLAPGDNAAAATPLLSAVSQGSPVCEPDGPSSSGSRRSSSRDSSISTCRPTTTTTGLVSFTRGQVIDIIVDNYAISLAKFLLVYALVGRSAR